ncbi:uncharacterized protein [Nicotiana sylvestris]|uniref:uncharacterized protein n=1 Tax=Nicotiana sylvestris TaxID=4096 RepID=UPI00388CC1EA
MWVPRKSSPRRSREGTPDGSHANGNAQFENDEAINEALQKLIAQQVVAESPASHEKENQKQLKEQSDRIEQIPGVSPIIKGIDMDKYPQQPWKPNAAPLPIPKKFKLPDVPKYNGTPDLRHHVTAFTTGVKGNNLTKQEIESVLVKTFSKTLTKGELTWYSLLPENSINSFAELVDSFIKEHSGAQKSKKRMEDIFKIMQGDSELLREFVDKFQRETMTLPHVPDNWAAIAFTSNLNEKSSEATRRLKESLCEFPATTWNDVYNRSMGDKVQWPKEMRSNPSRRNPDHWCEFHNDHGHKTADCRLLQGEVDHLLKQEYLTELFSERGKQAYMKNRQEPPKPPSPKRTINVISRGEDINGVTYTTANKISNVTFTQGKWVRHVLEEESITFDDADADGVLSLHNDALVITLLVHDTNVKRVIDPGSSVNIILLRVLREMHAKDKLIPKAHTLSGFDNSSVVMTGEQLQNPVEGTTTQTSTEQGRTNVDSRPGAIQELEGKENIKTTIEELEVVIFFAQWPERKVYVGANLSQDMKGIPLEVMTHKLNEDPTYFPVKQKKRKQGTFENQVIQDEVQKLLKIRSIHEIKMDPVDEEKTSFITDRKTYCYKVMPFGLKNTGATYQRLVTKMFQEHLGKTMEVYIDDMLVKTQHSGDHTSHLSDTFQILQKFNMKLNPEKCAFSVASDYAIEEILDMLTSRKEVQRLTGRVAALGRFISKSSKKCFKFFSALKKKDQFEWTEECQQALKIFKAYLSNPSLLAKPKAGERLLIYLVVSEVAVSVVLVREDQVIAYPLRNILHKHKLSGRLAKWAIELSEYDITYQPRTVKKSQVLADFVADFSQGMQLEAEKELQVFNGSNLGIWTLFTDGSSNVKGACLGIVLIPSTGETIRQAIKCHSITNDGAEYAAVIAGLEQARELGINQIVIKSNSQVVVNQILGTYTAREVRMQQYLEKVRDLIRQFQTWKVMQISRDGNVEANALANIASATDVASNENAFIIHLFHSVLDPDKNEYGTVPKDKKKAHTLRKRLLDIV